MTTKWFDPNSNYYNPRGARHFYWNRQNILKYGPKWLDSPLALKSIPKDFMPELDIDP